MEHWEKQQVSELEDAKSQFPSGGKVLDLGACDGSTSKLFGSGWEWVGIDISPLNSSVIKGDAHKLEFPDEKFDIVISVAVFEHLHSPWIAIKEVSRVLKTGGYFLGTVAFLEPEHANSYFHTSRRGMSRLLEEGGLTKLLIEPTRKNWNVMTSMKLLPIPGIKSYNLIKSKVVFGLRATLIQFRIWTLKGDKKDRGLAFQETEKYRYSGAFRFKAQK